MNSVLTTAIALSVAVVGIAAALWFSMKMTERKEASGALDFAASGSDGAEGYQAPFDPCDAHCGDCD